MKRKSDGTAANAKECIIGFIPAFPTVDEALRHLYQQFPSLTFKPPIYPMLVKSQVYALTSNRTSVDLELTRLQSDGKVRLLKLEDVTDDSVVIMKAEDYRKSFQNVCCSSETDLNVIEKFCHLVLTKQWGLSIRKATLLPNFTDKEITILVHCGALTASSVDQWWISSPQLGQFLKVYKHGQRELLTVLRRQRFKELLLSAIARRKLCKGNTLGYFYHVLAHIGAGTLISVPTSSGSLIRISTE